MRESLTLFDMFMEDLDMGGRYGIFSEILEPRLEEIIREENIESIANLMDGKLHKLFHYMLGDEFATLFRTYLQLEARCPHTIGYDRRAQRSAYIFSRITTSYFIGIGFKIKFHMRYASSF